MDLADRYVNSECVKRMLQADQVLSYVLSLSLDSIFSSCCQFLWITLVPNLSSNYFVGI